MTPLGPNRQTPRRPHDHDDWIAIVVALGTLGGLAGWLLAGGFRSLDVSTNYSDILSSVQPTDETPHSEEGFPDPPLMSSPSDGDRLTADTTDPPPGPTASDPLVPLPALPSSPTSDAPPVSSASPQALETPVDVPLMVPDPQIPASDYSENRPVLRPALSFTDVPEGYWAKPYIDALTARGILDGLPEGTFEPNRSMTRAEFATQLANTFDFEPSRVNKAFNDIAPDYWAKDTIQEAFMMGFMTGYPEGDFRPDATLPRVQILIALTSGLSIPETSDPEELLQAYQDQADLPEWAREQVAVAIAANIVSPSPTAESRLQPNAPATRAEVATLIYNTLVYMGQVEPIN